MWIAFLARCVYNHGYNYMFFWVLSSIYVFFDFFGSTVDLILSYFAITVTEEAIGGLWSNTATLQKKNK